ncbi:MAG: protein phosphatase 2C domain-containing protein, partial [Bacteroidaceae bacterium]|nr:protein phosphatase 2C domain-containing protein [Bacteroidaceae bacterium]
MTELSISANSHRGKVRAKNEDMVLVSSQFIRDKSLITKVHLGPDSRYLVAVADGMGGLDDGDIASEEVQRSLCEFFEQLPGGLAFEDLEDVIGEWGAQIHGEINAAASAAGRVRGTTLVALLFYEGKILMLNCGDSRLYRYRNGVLSQLSHDHDLASVTGKASDSHILVNCIGAGAQTCYMDCEDITERVYDGDVYMLCSDGLSDMCSDS